MADSPPLFAVCAILILYFVYLLVICRREQRRLRLAGRRLNFHILDHLDRHSRADALADPDRPRTRQRVAPAALLRARANCGNVRRAGGSPGLHGR